MLGTALARRRQLTRRALSTARARVGRLIRYPWGRAAAGSRRRGRSSMAELQSSKLTVRVRFPSPALLVPAQVRAYFF